MASAPASMTGRNANAPAVRSSSRRAWTTTCPSWLSASPPWPGKCLAAAATPARRSPSAKAPARGPASAGVAPKALSPMAPPAGPPSASGTDARTRSKPKSCSVAHRSAPTAAIAASGWRPRTRAEGVGPMMGRKRETGPPSSSTMTRRPCGDWRRRPSMRAGTWSASTTLAPSRMTPPTPAAATLASEASLVACPMPTARTVAARMSIGAGWHEGVVEPEAEVTGPILLEHQPGGPCHCRRNLHMPTTRVLEPSSVHVTENAPRGVHRRSRCRERSARLPPWPPATESDERDPQRSRLFQAACRPLSPAP